MIHTAFQNDTILKQLDKAVNLKSVDGIQVQRQLIEPSKIRLVESIGRRDSIRSSEQETSKPAQQLKKTNVKEAYQVETFSGMDSIVAIVPKSIQATAEKITKPEIRLPEKRISNDEPDWSIGLFIFVLILFATVKLFFNKYLNQLFSASINYSTSLRLFREGSLNILHGSFRLEILFYIVFSYFLFQIGQEFGYSYKLTSLTSYFIILGGVVAYFSGKRIVYFLLGLITENKLPTQEYLFNFNQYMRVLGLILLPVSLIINFVSLSNLRILFLIGIVLVFIVYLLALLRGARILLTKHFSISYLILYLCTLEILPLVFIYKLLLV